MNNYILDTSLLLDICIMNIFSHSVYHLLILLMVIFKEQRLLILLKLNLQFFHFNG